MLDGELPVIHNVKGDAYDAMASQPNVDTFYTSNASTRKSQVKPASVSPVGLIAHDALV